MYILEPQYPWLLTRSGQVYNHDRSYLTRLNLNWSQDIHLPGNRQLSYAWGLGLPVIVRPQNKWDKKVCLLRDTFPVVS